MNQQTKLNITCTCLGGLEDLLENEIITLGGDNTLKGSRYVSCEASLQTMYRINIHSRYALRVLMKIADGRANDEQQLYQFIYKQPWPHYFEVNKSMAVRVSFGRHTFRNTHHVLLKAKDAVVDRFRDEVKERPSIETKKPQVVIHLHIHDNIVSCYLDSSAYSLHKRGYKKRLRPGSLNETLAAAMYAWADWDDAGPIFSPMCGSGTLAIEASLSQQGKSAQQGRSHFGYQHWINYIPALHNDSLEDYQPKKPIEIIASDIDKEAIHDCQINAQHAGVVNSFQFKVENIFKQSIIGPALVLINPPYDIKVKQNNIDQFYADLGKHIKFNFKQCRCGIISGNIPALKKIGFRPFKKVNIMNGPLESRIHYFDVY